MPEGASSSDGWTGILDEKLMTDEWSRVGEYLGATLDEGESTKIL